MGNMTKEQEIIKLLFKDSLTFYNSRSISNIVGISHAGAFKILKKLEKRQIVNPLRVGKAIIYSLNKENPITLREIEMVLTLEAQNYKRWIEEFKNIQDKVKFAILFGSIIKNESSAKDIDLLIIADKEKFSDVRKLIKERDKFLNKKVHLLLQTPEEFTFDLGNKNKVTLEIIKKGIVLFGQEEARKII